MLNGIKNFLQFINDNWTAIVVIISLICTLVLKVKNLFQKDNDQKFENAKTQISQVMLKLIADAEIDYETWNKAGSIKRSQVIQKIYADYPILSKITDQTAVIEWIDSTINESLKTLRKIVSENQKEETTNDTVAENQNLNDSEVTA